MVTTLYYHPLSSFCWKALIGLYELDFPFEKKLVNFQDPDERAAFQRLWPIGKFPLLTHADRVLPESSVLLEYASALRRGHLIPAEPARALECRLLDRVYDEYIHIPMQKCVDDILRPEGKKDPHGVEHAKARMTTAYGVVEDRLAVGPWALGADFTLVDCAAFPALYYANRVHPIGAQHTKLTAYLERLKTRPSVARVFDEAAPFMKMFPG